MSNPGCAGSTTQVTSSASSFLDLGQEHATECDESINCEFMGRSRVDSDLVVDFCDANGVRGRSPDSNRHTRRDVSVNKGISHVREPIDIGHRIRRLHPVPLCRAQTVHRSRGKLTKVRLPLCTSCQIRQSSGAQVDRGHC